MTKDSSYPAFPIHRTPFGGLTKREYAAIHLCVPDSGDPEIDAMINRARRDRFAGAALQGLLAGGADAAFFAFQYADDMLKESNNED